MSEEQNQVVYLSKKECRIILLCLRIGMNDMRDFKEIYQDYILDIYQIIERFEDK